MNTALGNIIAFGLTLVEGIFGKFVTSIGATYGNLADGSAACNGYVNVQLNSCGDTLVSNLATMMSALSALGGEIFVALGAVTHIGI